MRCWQGSFWGQMVIRHHVGGLDLLLLFCEHLQELSLVLGDRVQDAQGDMAHS